METHDLAELMENGTLVFCDREEDACGLCWNRHPSFAGVSLKHLITGKDTDGGLSCHLVRIEPGCMLENHTHEGQWELHEVVKGAGVAILDGKEVGYAPGKAAVIPMGTPHSVKASDQGLFLFAKFFPALV